MVIIALLDESNASERSSGVALMLLVATGWLTSPVFSGEAVTVFLLCWGRWKYGAWPDVVFLFSIAFRSINASMTIETMVLIFEASNLETCFYIASTSACCLSIFVMYATVSKNLNGWI